MVCAMMQHMERQSERAHPCWAASTRNIGKCNTDVLCLRSKNDCHSYQMSELQHGNEQPSACAIEHMETGRELSHNGTKHNGMYNVLYVDALSIKHIMMLQV